MNAGFFCLFLVGCLSGGAESDRGEWKSVTVDVSAYCPCKLCCGPKARGITASGKRAVGKIVAAPKSWPFGTRVWVPGWGEGVVEDRGGAIKSAGQTTRWVTVNGKRVPPKRLEHDRIDLLFPTHDEALRWGRRTMKVLVCR